MFNKLFKIFAAGCLVAAVLSGCGGSGSSTSSSSLSKAQFIKRADAICESTNKAQLAAVSKASKEIPGGLESLGQAKQQEELLAVSMPVVQREVEKIKALGSPSGSEAEVAEILEGIEEGVKKSEEGATFASLEALYASVNQRASKFGFVACAESP